MEKRDRAFRFLRNHATVNDVFSSWNEALVYSPCSPHERHAAIYAWKVQRWRLLGFQQRAGNRCCAESIHGHGEKSRVYHEMKMRAGAIKAYVHDAVRWESLCAAFVLVLFAL